jgi:hypothetical protein
MYNLLESNSIFPPRIVGSYDSCASAILAAYEMLDIAHFEADEENPGCADMITNQGVIYMIEPAARRP